MKKAQSKNVMIQTDLDIKFSLLTTGTIFSGDSGVHRKISIRSSSSLSMSKAL